MKEDGTGILVDDHEEQSVNYSQTESQTFPGHASAPRVWQSVMMGVSCLPADFDR